MANIKCPAEINVPILNIRDLLHGKDSTNSVFNSEEIEHVEVHCTLNVNK